MTNYKAPLMKSLEEAGYPAMGARLTFTNLRKGGTRRMKLWLAGDVFYSPVTKQKKLAARLKANYGDAYLGAYFIRGARNGLGGSRSFCIILKGDYRGTDC